MERRRSRGFGFGRNLRVGAIGSSGLLAVLAGVFPVSAERILPALVALVLAMLLMRTPFSLLVDIVRRLRWFIVSIALAHVLLGLVPLLRGAAAGPTAWIGDGRILLDLVSPGLATAVGLMVVAGWAGWWVRGWPWSIVVLGGAWPAFVLAMVGAPANAGVRLSRAWLIFWLRVVVVARAWLRYASSGQAAHDDERLGRPSAGLSAEHRGGAEAESLETGAGRDRTSSVAMTGAAEPGTAGASAGNRPRPLQRLERALADALEGRDLAARPIDADPMVSAGLQSIVRLQQSGATTASGVAGCDRSISRPAIGARWRQVSWSLRRLYVLARRMETVHPDSRSGTRVADGSGASRSHHDAGSCVARGSPLSALVVVWLTVAVTWVPRLVGG